MDLLNITKFRPNNRRSKPYLAILTPPVVETVLAMKWYGYALQLSIAATTL
jgi:hypothetical protein